MPRRTSFSVFAGFAIVASLASQSRVLVVDDGPESADHVEIQPAIAAARDGDVVLVRTGRYAPFTVDGTAVTIVAEREGLVEVVMAGTFPGRGIEIVNIAASQTVVLRGLAMRMHGAASQTVGPLRVRGCSGVVWLEDCELVSYPGGWSLRAEGARAVVLSRCRLQGAALGTNSGLHAYDSSLSGQDGANASSWPVATPAGSGLPALTLDGGFLFVAGSTIAGGAGGDGLPGSSQCYAGDGGDGLVLRSGGPVARHLDASIQGGRGGLHNGPCGTGTSGAPIRVSSGIARAMSGDARRAHSNAVSHGGSPVRWRWTGEPGDRLAFVLIGARPAAAFALGYNGTMAVASPVIVPLGGLPPDGRLDVELIFPPLPATTQCARLFVQGVFVDATPVGWLSAPSCLVGVSLQQPGALGRDCNQNNVNDVWELMNGADDVDHDGVLDECQVFRTLYVDDDAPGDPGPGVPTISDPLEDGSAAHPFDAIQEGIDAATASPYTIVAVLAGTYVGPGNVGMDFRGRPLTVRGVAGAAATVIDCQGQARAFRFTSGEAHDARIEGLRIVNGVEYWGGAIHIDGASPTIVGCEFANNRAVAPSGFIAKGGAIYAEDSALALRGCLFEGNTADGHGAGLAYDDSGVSSGIRRQLTVRDCTFRANSARIRGGGMHLDPISAVPFVERCTFEGNVAGYGGGVSCDGTVQLSNSVFTANRANYDGGGLAVRYGAPTVRGTTFAGNRAREGGGIDASNVGDMLLHDSILWGNTANPGPQLDLYFSDATVAYSDVEGGRAAVGVFRSTLGWGVGNLSVDPLFVAAGDVRLSAGSPCVDAGDPAYLPLLTERDRARASRRRAVVVDMGAFER